MPLPTATLENVDLDVISKYKKLTDASLGTKSFFMRVKDTFREILSNGNVGNDEYAKATAEFLSRGGVDVEANRMQTALQWAVQEKEMAYSLALTKANIELVLAQRAQIEASIAQTEKETEYKGAQIKVTLASSIRENGRFSAIDIDGNPTALMNEGLKYYQGQAQQANLYSVVADAYRKSGVVTFGYDQDGFLRPITGDMKGYTWAQERFAVRQITSFEDSKRHQAGNILSALMGQMLSSETPPEPQDISRLRTAVDYLNSNSPVST